MAYVDGQYLPHRSAAVHIEDRGYQFADGVYEVMAVIGGCLLDEGPHLARLARSLAELRIPPPMSNAALRIVMREVIRRNGVRDGIVYVQVTRGVAARDQAFPVTARPVLVVTARCKRRGDPRAVSDGVAVITIPTFAGSAATSNQWLSCRTCLASSGPRRLVSSRLGK